jgi:succinate dehydrogenase/fumarate reductase flavoprotein subunit
MLTYNVFFVQGGITVDTGGHVVRKNGTVVQGLYAAGEVSGGVHGENRLAGNSLLECTVFGMIVGNSLPLQKEKEIIQTSEQVSEMQSRDEAKTQISAKQLALHNSPDDCWVAIHGSVYDLSNFAEEHPPGPKSIWDVAGKDGTESFQAVHSKNILEDFQDVLKGVYIP